MEARPWPSAAYISSNNGDNSTRAASAKRLIVRSGWSAGINVSGSTNANMLTCFLVRPRTALTSDLGATTVPRSEEHTSELQSRFDLVCRLLLEKKNNK